MSGDTDRYATILESIRDGVYMLDPDGDITYVNNAALEEHDIGYDRDELLGAHVSKLLSDGDIEKCLSIIQDLLEENDRETGRCEIDIVTADGRTFPCELQLTVLSSEHGDFQGTVGVVRDITERKRREQRLEVLHRVLRHNLRNDMSVVIGRAKLLEDALSGEYESTVRTVREKGENLITISEKVRQILHLRNVADEEAIRIDVLDAIEPLLAEFREEYPDVEIHLDAPTGVRATVKSEELFTTALRNLLENAIEHNDRATPRVTIEIGEDDGRVTIRIEDDGPGIPEMEREVFEEGTESPLKHSKGLGLWLVYWSVMASNGEITFEDPPSGGTIVTLSYPVPDDRADA